MDYGHTNNGLKVLKRIFIDLFTNAVDGLESSGLFVDYYDAFIRCLDSHSDGTHSLQSNYFSKDGLSCLNIFLWHNIASQTIKSAFADWL